MRRAKICVLLLGLLAAPALAQQPRVLKGHTGWVGGLAFSPTQPLLATGSADRTIKLWPLDKGEPVTLQGHTDTVAALAISRDGKFLASAGYDETALLWDLGKQQKLHTCRGHKGAVMSVAFAPDGKTFVTGGMDGKVQLWDVATGKNQGTISGHTSWVNAVAFSAQGILATGSSDNSIRTWKFVNERWQLKEAYPIPFGEVRSLAFAPDGTSLAAGIRYGHLMVFDFLATRVITKKAHVSDIWSLAFSPDGATLATGDGDWDQPGDIRLWSTETWKEIRALQHSNEVLSLGFAADGKSLAAGSWDKTIRLWSLIETAAVAPPNFQLTFAQGVTARPFTGRVFLLTAKNPTGDLPAKPKWFNPEPFFAQDVKGWQPGETLNFEPALGCPHPFAKLPPGKYAFQAVMDLDQGGQNCIGSPGNGYSKPHFVEIGSVKGPVALHIDQIYPERRFIEKERVKLVDIESKLLSNFHRKPIRLRAGVVLPKSFDAKSGRKYPVVYEIPGFGGDHHGAFAAETRNATDVAGVDMIHVVLDPACRTGHHVFADSANNGPYGQALIEELIPHLEAKFPALAVPRARFLTGHSSGGWSSLWLQVTYPNFFGGTWSTAPDPVDFRDFQKVNIYDKGIGLFIDGAGAKRPLARKGDKVLLYYQPFSDLEHVMGRGGQLSSFEAVFSPRGPDGQPRSLWDRTSGLVSSDVAQTWEKYDIRLILERNWKTLGPQLAGKLHVYMGSEDTFYLEGATILLQKSLKELGSDARVEIFAGKDHGNLVDANLRGRIAREMAAAFQTPKEDPVRKAVGKVLPLLEKGAAGHAEKRTCFACHNQGVPLFALAAARSRGFTIDEKAFAEQVKFIAGFLERNKGNFLKGKGTGGQVDTAGYALLTLERAGYKADETTTAVVDYLLQRDKDKDHWRPVSNRPPTEGSLFTTNYLGMRGLQVFGGKEQKDRLDERVTQVRTWIEKSPARDTEDRVFRLWALKRAGSSAKLIEDAAQDVIKSQGEAGGWAQLDTQDPDAYATGAALVALHEAAGLPTNDPVYVRGVTFLLRTQLEDGSWHVRSRSKPFQTYYESGFPHSKDQFISIAASAWAANALILALPEK